MREIKQLNEDAFKYLIAILPRHVLRIALFSLYIFVFNANFVFQTRFWSRSRFTAEFACDTLVNNMSKGFNNTILDARSKPILTMMEKNYIYLMKRWASN